MGRKERAGVEEEEEGEGGGKSRMEMNTIKATCPPSQAATVPLRPAHTCSRRLDGPSWPSAPRGAPLRIPVLMAPSARPKTFQTTLLSRVPSRTHFGPPVTHFKNKYVFIDLEREEWRGRQKCGCERERSPAAARPPSPSCSWWRSSKAQGARAGLAELVWEGGCPGAGAGLR